MIFFFKRKKENLKSLHTENEDVTYTHICAYSPSTVTLESNDTEREHSKDDKHCETHTFHSKDSGYKNQHSAWIP